MKTFIRPYNPLSQSAKDLSTLLNAKRILPPQRSHYRPKRDHLIINWGSSLSFPTHNIHTFLNHPESVALASNKLATFEALNRFSVPTVEWTTSQAGAQSWLQSNSIVLGRDTVSGRGGQGITIYHPRSYGDREVGSHLYYTRYICKTHEWRLHIFQSSLITSSTKRRSFSEQEVDRQFGAQYIRSHTNGYVFCVGRDHIPPPNEAVEIAKKATEALSLDFAAIDLIAAQRGGFFVLEANTAPGLDSTVTKEAYKTAIEEISNG